jgi:hypothetical protein
MSEGRSGFEGWAILELRGQRRLGGRISEATVAGAAFIRIDVPHPNDSTLIRATHFYSPTAVQAITPTTVETACAIARGFAGHCRQGSPSPSSSPPWEAGAGEGIAADAAEGEPWWTAPAGKASR